MEGYPRAAANFCKEANLEPLQDEESVEARQEIQDFILRGDIQSAIEALNELDPLVSNLPSSNLALFFMIRTRVYTCTTHMVFGSVMRNNHLFMTVERSPSFFYHVCL